MATSIVVEIRKRLVRFRGQYPRVCERAGIPYSWLNKFARGIAQNPTVRRLESLQQALDELEAESGSTVPGATPINNHHETQGEGPDAD